MIGYIFPRGNGVGVPGEDPNNPSADSTDRFGCGHSDDSEAASSQAGDIMGSALVDLLDSRGLPAERTVTGRYVLPDGSLSRDPLGRPVVKCDVDQTYQPNGPATAVFVSGEGVFRPQTWLALDGRPQAGPDRNTRGYYDAAGRRVWLDVWPDVAESPSYARPKGATPLRVSLVPAFRMCAAPNRTHGSPLAFPSCAPPVQASPNLTIGTPDANARPANSIGSVRLDVVPGDVVLNASLTDVRDRSTLADYTGELDQRTTVRVTDAAGGGPATGEDFQFGVTVPCAATPSAGVGATCAISTSFDAVVPGAIAAGDRAIWELGDLQVYDGGSDGVASTSGNSLFARQGVFVP
jgi:hypothetical protein